MASELAASLTAIGARNAVISVEGHVYNAVQLTSSTYIKTHEQLRHRVERLIRKRYRSAQTIWFRSEYGDGPNPQGLWLLLDAAYGKAGYPGGVDGKEPVLQMIPFGTGYSVMELH